MQLKTFQNSMRHINCFLVFHNFNIYSIFTFNSCRAVLNVMSKTLTLICRSTSDGRCYQFPKKRYSITMSLVDIAFERLGREISKASYD